MANKKKSPEDRCSRINISIPQKIWVKFADLADKNGRAYSNVISDLIVRYMRDEYDLIDTGIKWAKIKDTKKCINLSSVKFINAPNKDGDILVEMCGYPDPMSDGVLHLIELPFVDNPFEVLSHEV